MTVANDCYWLIGDKTLGATFAVCWGNTVHS